jgi:hypothetical protein
MSPGVRATIYKPEANMRLVHGIHHVRYRLPDLPAAHHAMCEINR